LAGDTESSQQTSITTANEITTETTQRSMYDICEQH